MKYIDADTLKERVTRLIASARQNDWPIAEDYLRRVIDIMDSLQQEQPDGYNRAMLEVKEKVDKLYEETSIGLNEYDSGLYNGIAETCMKLRGFIKARLDSDEQPEVDLEKEIDAFFDKWDKNSNGSIFDENGAPVTIKTIKGVVKHFLNARKED